jgi:hypothetical protein
LYEVNIQTIKVKLKKPAHVGIMAGFGQAVTAAWAVCIVHHRRIPGGNLYLGICSMTELELFYVDIRRTCFVYETSADRIYGWVKKETRLERLQDYLSPKTWEELGHPVSHSDYRFIGETMLDGIRSYVVLGAFRKVEDKLIAKGMINVHGEISNKHLGKEIVLSIECTPLFDNPSKKLQVNISCAGDDVNNTLVNFFNEFWTRFLTAFDAQTAKNDQSGQQDWQAVKDEPKNKLLEVDLKPWEHIPDRGDDRKIIEMWCEGQTAKVIGQHVAKQAETVMNTISKLRKEFPGAKIPMGKERKFLRKQD